MREESSEKDFFTGQAELVPRGTGSNVKNYLSQIQLRFIWDKGKPNSPSSRPISGIKCYSIPAFSHRNSYFLPISLVALGAKQAYSRRSEQWFTAVVVAASVGREDDLAVRSSVWIVLGRQAPMDLDNSY